MDENPMEPQYELYEDVCDYVPPFSMSAAWWWIFESQEGPEDDNA